MKLERSLPGVHGAIFAALSVPVFGIGLLCALLLWQVTALSEYNREVGRTHEVIAQTLRVNKLLIDHETGLRAYLLSHERPFLQPYSRARGELPDAVDNLRELVGDNPAQQAGIELLRGHYVAWLGTAEEAIARARGGRVEVSPAFLDEMRVRKGEMDDVRESLQSLLATARQLLAERQRAAERTTGRLLFGGALAALLLGIAAAIAIRRLFSLVEASYSEANRVQGESVRRAEEASRAKDQFLATLSHELRTPLNAIVGFAHILTAKDLEAGTTAKAVAIIHRNSMVLNQLISDILDVSRIITGKLRLDVKAVNLSDVVAQAMETVSSAAREKDIHLDLTLSPRAGPFSGDPARLQQVVWNLLANAIKFSPPGGRVRVHLAWLGSHVELIVEDDGPGIPQDLLPHVFERFRQGDASASRSHGGLGLGLAIVQHLVGLHRGTVSVANREDTSGAVFTVRFPLPSPAAFLPAVPATPPGRADGAWVEQAPSLTGLRVLAVDDEADARELLTEVLERCGAAVLVASSVSQAVSALVRELPHVVIADLGMPGEDGYAFISRIRALPSDQGGLTPALALTAFAGSEDRQRALRAGFQVHLAKPVEPGELARVVRNLAGANRAHTSPAP